MKYRIGTRGSALALAQADHVRNRLAKAYPDHEFEIRVIRTTGDRVAHKPLHEIGGKGVFVKEIEEEILDHKADIGVHSMKDMPSCPAPGLVFAKAWKREDPRDALVLREKRSLEELPKGAVIGTGSRRREFQIKLHLEGTAFQKKVWEALCTIPYGETRSYGEIAAQIGNPKAYRAVGGANNKNPIMIFIPCHRVIGADGSLVGFGGGIDAKKFMLDLERKV